MVNQRQGVPAAGDAGAAPPQALSRRTFLVGLSATALAIPLTAVTPAKAHARIPFRGVDVRPRADWAQGLTPTGPLQQERPGDTRFLLVHHTASSNDYDPGDVPGLLRGFYRYHTGPDKKWPDIAYNFLVDRYGTVWEGRTGSLTGPVMPDATGGSQGFAQLGCFIGNHQAEAPTPEARTSMTALLAALADTYAIDTAPGATTTFVSRGSNRWPAGTTVTTTTIAGHRDMSLTTCPGDAAYALVRDVFPAAVTALRPTPL
ncbi:N-acetylmuramoyl-L-alanine amidase [Geodermatophilus sp. URMC 61]|uniref:N-acetylmuramoyl-L-alanine amidase n=1 Tax=Geodermatophilus sp. URMC 61 TaxID=3423411 RepID=UPI00406CF69A